MYRRFLRLFFSVARLRSWLGIFILLGIFSALGRPLAWAQALPDYSYLISDSDLVDYQAMSQAQVQAFLELHTSPLATYADPITQLQASRVIMLAAEEFKISPKFLLVLMQKEQSLVDDPTPLPSQFDWATGYGVCDGCDVSDPYLQKFKGFYNQVYNAAERIRTAYLVELAVSGRTASGFGPGITKLVDGVPVTPANQATAVLFTYTPHLHGNQVFAAVWDRYFTRSYPDGTLLNVEGEPEVWRIEEGQRRKFASKAVFLSFFPSFDRVLEVNRSEVMKYPEGTPIRFANYTFARVPRGTVYLIVDGAARGFDSREALRRIGVSPEEIVKVSVEDIAQYRAGEPITIKSLYPLGTLWQDMKTGGVFWVKDGTKHPIFSREILKANFSGKKITKKTVKELAALPTGDPVLFRDGELVRIAGEETVYLISNAERRPFSSLEALRTLGFDEHLIITSSLAAIGLHELGAPIGALTP